MSLHDKLAHATIDDLTKMIWDLSILKPSTKRILISISGVPGAGKLTLASQLCEDLNQMFRESDNGVLRSEALSQETPKSHISKQRAMAIPMDGFHLSRAQLHAMANPKVAIHRRGAAFTFAAADYCRLVLQLSQPLCGAIKTIYAPSFDHATKDSVTDSIAINEEARIILLEGNYVNLDHEPWSSVAGLFDLKLRVDVDKLVARERLIRRHIASGICEDGSSACYRIDSSDDLNADDILSHEIPGVSKIVLV